MILGVTYDERLHDVGHRHLTALAVPAALGALRRGEPADLASRRPHFVPELISSACGSEAAPWATPASRSGEPAVRPNSGGPPVAAIRVRQWLSQ